MSKKCPKCYQKIKNKSEFCMYCGCNIMEEENKIKVNEQLQEKNNKNDIVQDDNVIKQHKLRKNIIMLASIFIITIVIAIIILYIATLTEYNKAIRYMEKNEYTSAIEIFERLGSYKDSEKKLRETEYNKTIYDIENRLFSDENSHYEFMIETEQLLKEFGDYKESAKYLVDIQYKLANFYFEKGNYENAKKYYDLVNDTFDISYKLDCIDILSNFQGKWIEINSKGMGIKITGTKVSIYWFKNGKVTDAHEYYINLNSLSKDTPNKVEMRLIGAVTNDVDILTCENLKLIWKNGDYYFEFEKGDFTEEKIQNPQIGMTSEEVLSSTWGKPKDINKSIYSWGVREQWVYYGNKYIYLEDGIVTSIHE